MGQETEGPYDSKPQQEDAKGEKCLAPLRRCGAGIS